VIRNNLRKWAARHAECDLLSPRIESCTSNLKAESLNPSPTKQPGTKPDAKPDAKPDTAPTNAIFPNARSSGLLGRAVDPSANARVTLKVRHADS
jgi:hypothetical protein